jgi:hypothetical protein
MGKTSREWGGAVSRTRATSARARLAEQRRPFLHIVAQAQRLFLQAIENIAEEGYGKSIAERSCGISVRRGWK